MFIANTPLAMKAIEDFNRYNAMLCQIQKDVDAYIRILTDNCPFCEDCTPIPHAIEIPDPEPFTCPLEPVCCPVEEQCWITDADVEGDIEDILADMKEKICHILELKRQLGVLTNVIVSTVPCDEGEPPLTCDCTSYAPLYINSSCLQFNTVFGYLHKLLPAYNTGPYGDQDGRCKYVSESDTGCCVGEDAEILDIQLDNFTIRLSNPSICPIQIDMNEWYSPQPDAYELELDGVPYGDEIPLFWIDNEATMDINIKIKNSIGGYLPVDGSTLIIKFVSCGTDKTLNIIWASTLATTMTPLVAPSRRIEIVYWSLSNMWQMRYVNDAEGDNYEIARMVDATDDCIASGTYEFTNSIIFGGACYGQFFTVMP